MQPAGEERWAERYRRRLGASGWKGVSQEFGSAQAARSMAFLGFPAYPLAPGGGRLACSAQASRLTDPGSGVRREGASGNSLRPTVDSSTQRWPNSI